MWSLSLCWAYDDVVLVTCSHCVGDIVVSFLSLGWGCGGIIPVLGWEHSGIIILSLGWGHGSIILDTELGTCWCLPCYHIVDIVGSSLLAFGGHGNAICVCGWGAWCHPVHGWGLWCHRAPGDPVAEWRCIKPSVPWHCGGAGGVSAQPAPCPALWPHQLCPCRQPCCPVRGAPCPGVGSLRPRRHTGSP